MTICNALIISNTCCKPTPKKILPIMITLVTDLELSADEFMLSWVPLAELGSYFIKGRSSRRFSGKMRMPSLVRNKSGSTNSTTSTSASSNETWRACSKSSWIASLMFENSTISHVNLTFSGSCYCDGSTVTVNTGFLVCKARFFSSASFSSNSSSLMSISAGSVFSGCEKLISTSPVCVMDEILGTGLGETS